jgi:hypothetical protein
MTSDWGDASGVPGNGMTCRAGDAEPAAFGIPAPGELRWMAAAGVAEAASTNPANHNP